jgi:hypothetical protein
MGEKSSASVAADFLRAKTLPHRLLRIFNGLKLLRMIRRRFSTGENSAGSFAANF